MAPLRPLPGKSATPVKSILKRDDVSKPASRASEPLFPTTKQDKRRIRHAQLMSKVTKPASSKPRRRRPNKKLVTTLDALAEALPNDTEESDSPNEGAGSRVADQFHIIKRKSMKSRAGAMKRKQKLDNNERDRFAKNLAQMAVPASAAGSATSTEKLRALRGFISRTLDTRPDMARNGG